MEPTAARSTPIVSASAAKDAPRTTTGAPGSPVPESWRSSISLFGDRPDLEPVPFESRVLANLTQHTFTAEGLDFDPDVSPDGRALAFASTRKSERPDIYVKDVDGASLTLLVGDPADDIQPRFSPDGRRLAFCSNRSGNWDIWLVDRDGGGVTALTADQFDEIAPAWSPDGGQIAFCVWSSRSRQWEIWTVALAQPGVRHFLGFGMFPSWSPDGSRLAFQRARERGSRWFSIWTMGVEGGEGRQPTEVAYSDSAACISPQWSRDGAAIVYTAVPGNNSHASGGAAPPAAADLWMLDLATGLRSRLTDGACTAFNPVCSAAGRVYFVSARAGTENIWSIDVGHLTADASPMPRVAEGEAAEPEGRPER
jgi:dipeptidyl aminopeptidase/acylaminoacyl peptidase